MKKLASVVVALASVVLLASCSLLDPLGLFSKGTAELARERAAEIIDALNSQDAAVLKSMFTEYARTEYSAEIDEGLEYLLSLFPDGDVALGELPTGSVERETMDGGRTTTLGGGSFDVTSGGKEYILYFADFTVNTIDPDNAGIYRMGAVLHTDSRGSDMESAFRSWASSIDLDARAGGPPGVFVGDSGELSRDRAAQVIDALNAHDAAALKGMFTDYARSEYSAEIDPGLEYLLSLFPDGDIVWAEDGGGSAINARIDGDSRTVMVASFYTVRSGGVDYRLFFTEFTENSLDPDNLGIYAIGAVPTAEKVIYMPESELHAWSNDFYLGADTPPGVFVPQ